MPHMYQYLRGLVSSANPPSSLVSLPAPPNITDPQPKHMLPLHLPVHTICRMCFSIFSTIIAQKHKNITNATTNIKIISDQHHQRITNTQVRPHLLPMQPRRREREKRERVCGCLHLTGLPCAGPFHILESIHGTILLGSILKYIDIYTCSVCFQLYLEATTLGIEVASVINLSETSGACCLFVYD